MVRLLCMLLLTGTVPIGPLLGQQTPPSQARPFRPSGVILDATDESLAYETEAAATSDSSPFRSRSTADGERERSGQSLPLTTVISSLAIVLGLFGGLVWVLRRSGGTGMSGVSKESVQILGRTPLAPRQNLVLVRCGQRILVLAVGGTNTSTLAEITDPDEVAEMLAQLTGTERQQFHQTLRSLGTEKPASDRFVGPDDSDRPKSLFANA